MNGPEPETHFDISHLKTAIAQHSELGCHTYGHIDLSKTATIDGIADIERNQEVLQTLLPVGIQKLLLPFQFRKQADKRIRKHPIQDGPRHWRRHRSGRRRFVATSKPSNSTKSGYPLDLLKKSAKLKRVTAGSFFIPTMWMKNSRNGVVRPLILKQLYTNAPKEA